MKKIINSFMIFILTIILFGNSNVFAGNTGGGNSTTTPGGCASSARGCDWSYPSDVESFAVRLSLYKYDGNNVTYYGSNNYCANGTNSDCLTYVTNYASTQKGKVAYQQLGGNPGKFDKRGVVSKKTSIIFPKVFTEKEDGNWNAIEAKVKEAFELNSGNKTLVLGAIKSEFKGNGVENLKESDVGNLYITIEPALLFKANSNYYFGTAYEIASWLGTDGKLAGSVTQWLYLFVPNSIVAKRQTGDDKYKFIGNLVYLITKDKGLNTSVWNEGETRNRINNVKKVTSKEGHGINVFWLGNYTLPVSCTITEATDKRTYTLNVQGAGAETVYYDIKNNRNLLKHNVKNNIYRGTYKDAAIYGAVYNANGNEVATCSLERTVQTCKQTCSGKSGDNLLSCAENYCQAASDNSGEKKTCIATCGYSDPGFSSCNANQSSSGVSTECDADTSSSLSTCTKANTSNYYRSNCSESSTISYGNSLPTTLTPGTGFTYTPVLSGEKTCQMTFELAKWKFDYASSYTEAERTKLKETLKNFQSIESNSTWVKDLDNKYKYDSSNATITIDITNNNDANASNRKTTKQLVPSKTINLLNNDVVVTAGGSNRVPLYSNGQVTYQSIYGLIKTTSKNKTAYKLPAVCISAGTGKMYDVNANGKCDTENDGPYHEYYTDLKIKKDTYKTEVTVNKGSSNLNATNTCRYVVESPVSCSIVEREDKYELLIENKNNVGITYGLSTRGYILNGNTIYSPISENIRLFGAIAIDNSIVATCKYQRGNPSDEENTCTRLYKAAEYDKIRDYCRTNWISDTANYGSERECFDSCSSGNNSCKHNPNFSSSDEKAVINYCKIESNYLKDGYNSVASCVNDCLSVKKDNNCLGITCDYIYRPISLRDPFPNNRRPGYNWFGKEIYITDDLLNPILDSTAQPEYVVELNQDRINEIKKNTKEYNSIKNKNAYIDYVRVNEYNLNGKYESMFIHSNDTSVGGFRSYFTVVETIPQ